MGFINTPLTLVALIKLRGKEIGEGTGLFNLSRQLGGSLGIALLATFITRQTMTHRAALVSHIMATNPLSQYRALLLQRYFMMKGSSPPFAYLRGMQLIDRSIQGQSAIMSFAEAFMLIALLFVASLPLLFLFKGGKIALRRKSATTPGE
jgi:DHA2 family multidrug resistance protein